MVKSIGFWILEQEDFEDGTFEIKVTQDGYRCWYFSTWDKAEEFAKRFKNTIDTDVTNY